MSEQIIPKRDIDFVLYEQLNIEQILGTGPFSDLDRKTCDLTIAEARRLAMKEFLPTLSSGDRDGAQFSKGEVSVPEAFRRPYDLYAKGGWIAMTEDPDMGGQGMPRIIAQAADEYFRGANGSLLMYGAMCHGTGRMIELFGTDEQKQLYVKPLYTGKWGGTMLLTESGAGSDVGNLSTVAEKNDDGTYSLTGNKIFITNGDQNLTENIVHVVLARIKGSPTGTEGISIFIVPKYLVDSDGKPQGRNGIHCTGIEEKMGLHGSATCSMAMGEKETCTGYLLGTENKGLKVMFHMMNEARLMMGATGCAAGSAVYLHALAYARERKQGRDLERMLDKDAPQVPIIRHPDVRRMLIEMKTLAEGMRSFVYYVAYLFDKSYCSENQDEKEKCDGLIELLTPVIKSYCSDKGFLLCNQAMMILGGSGYTRDYPIEQGFRDVKIAAIVEGTNGIQAMDLLGRKLGMKKGAVFMDLMSEIHITLSSARESNALKSLACDLEAAVNRLGETALGLGQKARAGELHTAFLSAHPFLVVMGDVIMAWMLLWRASVAEKGFESAGAKDRIFYEAQIKGAEFFIQTQLPETMGKMNGINKGCSAAFEMEEAGFGA